VRRGWGERAGWTAHGSGEMIETEFTLGCWNQISSAPLHDQSDEDQDRH
jgi:hypothetical protein